MKPSQMLKTCLNPKVLFGIGAVILLAYLFAPQLARYSWILFVLVCPISMAFMMKAMNPVRGREGSQRASASNGMNPGDEKPNKVFACTECGMSYQEAEWAKKCAAWCKEHHSCNLEITKHAVE